MVDDMRGMDAPVVKERQKLLDMGFILECPCFSCKYLLDYPACLAFPAGIPECVRKGLHDHGTPIEGDRGVRYSAQVYDGSSLDSVSKKAFMDALDEALAKDEEAARKSSE